jgi:hypothetical protein
MRRRLCSCEQRYSSVTLKLDTPHTKEAVIVVAIVAKPPDLTDGDVMPDAKIPGVSHETLAEMVGTTRA